VDLYDLDVARPYEAGMYLEPESREIQKLNTEAKALADAVRDRGAQKEKQLNELSARLNTWVYDQSQKILAEDKILGVVGGDHSTPLGAFRAVGEKFGEFGILHFDAHSDTREAYEGFTYSHASIMHNALREVPQLKKLVQMYLINHVT
jgi:agmatinase